MKFYKFILSIILLLSVWLIICLTVSAQQASYDLQAVSLTVTPTSPEINQDTTIRAVFRNSGNDFKMDFLPRYSASLDGFVSNSPTAISPAQDSLVKTNDYITINFYGVFTKLRENNLSVSIDLTGFLSEVNTSNNSVSGQAYVTGNDLIAESISIIPTSPAVNQTCRISIQVKNDGTYNLFSSTGLFPDYNFPNFSLSNSTIPNPSLANVFKPGDYLPFVYEGKFTSAGGKQLSFTIDPNDDLKQSNKNNDSLGLKVNVYPASSIDLSVDSLSLSLDKILLGKPLDITVNIKNSGSTSLIDATGFSSLDILPSFPNFVYDINTVTHDSYPSFEASLDPGAIFHYKYSGAFNQIGNFNLAFSLDKNNQLLEANENNNSTSTKISVYQDEKAADDFTILSKNVALVSSTSVIISWSTDVNTTGFINYDDIYSNVYNNKIEDTNSALTHALTISNLKQATNYNYLLTLVRGTVSKTVDLTKFTMPANDQLKTISGPTVTTDVANKTALVNWVTNLISNSGVFYKKKEDAIFNQSGSADLVSAHQVKLESLELSQYNYWVSSTSTSGTNVKSGLDSFEISAVETAPTSNTANQTLINQPAQLASSQVITVKNNSLYNKLRGNIILKVQSKGEAYYVNAKTKTLHYLGRPEDAFSVIRQQGSGITNAELAKIPLGLSNLSGVDSDNDGLPDTFEQAIGTDKNKADTDGDGHNDMTELASGFSPTAKGKSLAYDKKFSASLAGRILLQVQGHGEAWYISPKDGKRYFLARPADAFNIMRKLGLGITNNDFASLSK